MSSPRWITDGPEQIQRLLLPVIGRGCHLKWHATHQHVSTVVDGDRLKTFDEGAKSVGRRAVLQLLGSRLAFGGRRAWCARHLVAASALGVVLLVLTIAILCVASKFVSLDQMSSQGPKMGFFNRIVSETQIRLGQRLWLYIVAILILIFLAAPSFIVVPMSFSGNQYLEFPPTDWSTRWYAHYFNSPVWMAATWTSFKVAVLTIFVATLLGTMAAYGLLKSSTKLTRLLFVVMISPIMIPLILVAIGVFCFYVKVKMVNSILGLVLAHSLIAMPLVLIIVMSALNNYDMNQEKVACSLGATRSQAFFQITLPQIRFSIISSALIAFLTSFDGVIIALFTSGGPNSTITRSMFLSLRDQIDPKIASISTILIVTSSGLLIAAQTFGKRKDSD